LHLIDAEYVHLDDGAPTVPPTSGAHEPVAPTSFAPPPPSEIPARPEYGVAETGPVRSQGHSLGRTYLEDDQQVIVGYHVLLSDDGTVSGLLVMVSSDQGQRTMYWTVDGTAPGGRSMPVGRAEAERIAREVLGFVLPEEPALRDMVNG
jgi:hypothetical protein